MENRLIYKAPHSPFWEDRKVTVIGGGGFIGSHLTEYLVFLGSEVTVVSRNLDKAKDNLKSVESQVHLRRSALSNLEEARQAIKGSEIVFNLAAVVGGIGFNNVHPGSLFFSNASLGLNVLEASRLENIDRFLCTSSTCVYSRENSEDALEEFGHLDSPDPTVLGYGWAKRFLEIQAMMYHKEYGMKIGIVRPSNSYGPRADFGEESSHVIPALIQRIVGKKGTVSIWGNGGQTRSFIFVSDVARAMVALLEKYPVADPVNVGTDEEITIASLARKIAEISGSVVSFSFDNTKPEGQLKKYPNISKFKRTIAWSPQVNLTEGLTRTIQWYKRQPLSSQGESEVKS